MRSFDYYTGLVVEAYAPGVGLPLGGGGRYDGVLAAYGAPLPAAGFALGLERVMIALVEQGATSRCAARRRRRRRSGRGARGPRAALRRAGKRVALSAALGRRARGEARGSAPPQVIDARVGERS